MGKNKTLKIFDAYSKEILATMKNAAIYSSPYDYAARKREGQLTKEQALKLWADNGMRQIVEYCEAHPTCEGCSFRKEHTGCEFRGKSPREW